MSEPLLQGPPFLTGSLHIGHGVNLFVKDFYMRYQDVIKNRSINFVHNFDAQGLPVENIVLKENLHEKNSKEHIFSCLDYTKRVQKQMENVISKMGIYDSCPPKTLTTTNLDYKVKLMRFLVELYDKGLIYSNFKHIDYCYDCGSTLANIQLEDKKIKGKVYVFKAKLEENSILFATTEPQTVFHNTDLFLSPTHEYGLYEIGNERIYSGVELPGVLLKKIKGSDLKGLAYEIEKTNVKGFLKTSNQVLTNKDVCGGQTPYIKDYACLSVSPWGSVKDYQLSSLSKTKIHEESSNVCRDRCEKKKTWESYNLDVFKILEYEKNYDTCYRCKNKVGKALITQFYLKIEDKTRNKMVEDLKKVTFNDPLLREETIKFFSVPVDWAITRDRKFGTPFPVVKCKCGEVNVLNFYKEDFENESDCFTPLMSEVCKKKGTFCQCGKLCVPTQSVDVWIDSGFLALYYEKDYDCFIEGVDQKRGWFYCSAVLYYLKYGKLPYKNLVYLGWLVKRGGSKISKSLDTSYKMEDILKQNDYFCLRSFAISKASPNIAQYGPEIVELEKKYVNVILNVVKFLKGLPEQAKKDLVFNQTTKTYFDQGELLIKKLEEKFEKLQFHSYWELLKNYWLKEYSRKIINNHKKQGIQMKKLWWFLGLKLLKYTYPIIPEESIKEILSL